MADNQEVQKSEKEIIIEQKKEQIRAKVRKILERDAQLEEERVNRERKWAKYVITEEVVRQPVAAKDLGETLQEERAKGKVQVRVDSKTIVTVDKKDAKLVRGKWVLRNPIKEVPPPLTTPFMPFKKKKK